MKKENGETGFYYFPVEEADSIMTIMQLAEKHGNLEALKWCARRFLWI